MLKAARDGDVSTAAMCLLAYRGITSPTPEQLVGAHLEAFAFADLRLIALAHTKE